jgi:NAD(P)H-hydrate repair Nnr-like enzyme with NAD(P)H-hydrate dehydratase domain
VVKKRRPWARGLSEPKGCQRHAFGEFRSEPVFDYRQIKCDDRLLFLWLLSCQHKKVARGKPPMRLAKLVYEISCLYRIGMDRNYWHRQAADKPLFPELLWSRPENRGAAGKLLIIGGNLHGFAAPAEAYAEAVKAGVGVAKVLLPDATKRVLSAVQGSTLYSDIEFAPSTPSGSFSKQALAECIDHAFWADGVLLAGELGRNSETAILLEQFVEKYTGQLTLTKDAVDYFKDMPNSLLNRPETTLVVSPAQLQKLCMSARFPRAITLGMDLLMLIDALHELSASHAAHIVVKHHENLIIAADGEVSSTKLQEDLPVWRVKTAARAATWHLQNPTKPFESLTTAIYEFGHHD